jgi:hypothetical protein
VVDNLLGKGQADPETFDSGGRQESIEVALSVPETVPPRIESDSGEKEKVDLFGEYRMPSPGFQNTKGTRPKGNLRRPGKKGQLIGEGESGKENPVALPEQGRDERGCVDLASKRQEEGEGKISR